MTAHKATLLTTGQAAKLCSVTPDTILKWIKKGRLNGVRTAGGHYRIDRRDLESLTAAAGGVSDAAGQTPECYRPALRCWEYLSERGTVREDCRKCVVFRVGASRCFLMAGLESEVGHAHQFCQDSCEDCVYYRRLNDLATNVLVITTDSELIDRLSGEVDERIALRFAQNGYEASAIIHEFRPAFAVIDEERVLGKGSELLNCLASDARIPGLRLIIATSPKTAARKRRWSRAEETDPIVGVLEKPFGSRRLAAAISKFHLSFPTAEDRDLSTAVRREQR